ncbi:MAG: M14 family zinc carboxypeptidase [Gemmatimonadaceae bacterium]|nr:M14 family zinc carboxypeptidase [Gemmatimonadaceae bacterium]
MPARVFVPLAVAAIAAATPRAAAAQASQPIDTAYTRLIKANLRDARITSELVDYLPASATVPTPLAFHGRIVGQPGELTYSKDIHRYFRALDDASPRVKVWSIGTTEEGREMIIAAISDEQTIASLDATKAALAALTDPRRTSDAEAKRLIGTTKPIYWLTTGLHSPETGGPEVVQELAYRLAVDESDYIKAIRAGTVVFITPVLEPDGRDKHVDTYYYNKTLPRGATRLPLMYWGKYVAHDNNRDGMGQFLALTRNINRAFLEWHTPIMHDLHESVAYLYTSTGTGPYNEHLDPITIDEWWVLAKTEVMELTKRGIPGVWTYGFYDGWVPNYLFFAAHAHNATGRFYEVQSYGPDNVDSLRMPTTTTSREWFRPNPPLPLISWGPRNNANIQQTALLVALKHVADNRTLYLENYWLKNKRSVAKGKAGPTTGWVIPAAQRARVNAAEAVEALRTQGLEFHVATAPFTAGGVSVAAGDWVIRADQPYRTLADMYFAVQAFAAGNPRPYDDTGWTFQLMRNITVTPLTGPEVFTAPLAPLSGPALAKGAVTGSGRVLVVNHTTDNALVTFRWRHGKVKMLAAEDTFSVAGTRFAAGSFIVPDADRAVLEPTLVALGLRGTLVSALPTVATHELDLPRIGYIHSWQRTQDEGWVRAAFDTYGIPFTYFADQKLREGNLRAKYDVLVLPHIGGSSVQQINGIPKTGDTPLPYKKTAKTPNLGVNDQSDDIRGGMGVEGLAALQQFVRDGGTLITEGATSTIFPDFGITSGISVENPTQLFVRGSILRGIITDARSPIIYGYEGRQLPVYFSAGPVLNVGAGGGGEFGAGAAPAGVGMVITPMATPPRTSPYEAPAARASEELSSARAQLAGAGGAAAENRPRVVLAFPQRAEEMLLSGSLANGQALSGRAQVVDAKVGNGHVVMFAIRPFWRWQTHGTYFLGFNALLHWNDLDAGKK